ncbi:Fe-S domain protein [Ignavibacterium album JCM 16511]|uniref:Fe-S domain protein n=1 Tax=Ignavibacterium album (strain DSM 19864 / JCM 16511 / NBRC 101810 / Mat9-16) TaxID=945713 RepID=I0AG29_IGNAJ|nr:MOSC N-terminal beta barrel domain-containing protein [Ignavibacterium album]AFH47936.1 Fe-S domain protein [Ignavibacterium album JCM 16511]
MNLTLSEIFIYPIKSLGGISLTEALVEKRGLQYDRRIMLVDENGIFITQRDFPQMALLKTKIEGNTLTVYHPQLKHSIILSLNNEKVTSLNKIKVKIWDDICEASLISKEADYFFSDMIGIRCRLVYMPENEVRIVDRQRKYVADDHIVGFADGYPFLIIGQSSLDELNRRLENPLPINRFRPNFVFTGGQPFEEDRWKDFLIDEIKFRAVKPCARCVITTTDQQTAERSNEPLRTLSTFRRNGNKVLFGMNLVAYNSGKVKVGDNITLL